MLLYTILSLFVTFSSVTNLTALTCQALSLSRMFPMASLHSDFDGENQSTKLSKTSPSEFARQRLLQVNNADSTNNTNSDQDLDLDHDDQLHVRMPLSGLDGTMLEDELGPNTAYQGLPPHDLENGDSRNTENTNSNRYLVADGPIVTLNNARNTDRYCRNRIWAPWMRRLGYCAVASMTGAALIKDGGLQLGLATEVNAGPDQWVGNNNMGSDNGLNDQSVLTGKFKNIQHQHPSDSFTKVSDYQSDLSHGEMKFIRLMETKSSDTATLDSTPEPSKYLVKRDNLGINPDGTDHCGNNKMKTPCGGVGNCKDAHSPVVCEGCCYEWCTAQKFVGKFECPSHIYKPMSEIISKKHDKDQSTAEDENPFENPNDAYKPLWDDALDINANTIDLGSPQDNNHMDSEILHALAPLYPKVPITVNVISYNIQWWKVYGEIGNFGKDHLIAKNLRNISSGIRKTYTNSCPNVDFKHDKLHSCSQDIDFLALQECDDIYKLIKEYNSEVEYNSYSFKTNLEGYTVPAGGLDKPTGVAIAWNKLRWDKLEEGYEYYSEDSTSDYWGKRLIMWARFQHKVIRKKTVLFASVEGSYPYLDPGGGGCGARNSAYNIQRILYENMKKNDHVILAGELAAHPSSLFVKTLEENGLQSDFSHDATNYVMGMSANDGAEGQPDGQKKGCYNVIEKEVYDKIGSDNQAIRVEYEI